MEIPARLARVRNGLAKAFAGLRPFNESVWPGVRNDLFVAHESIYVFASQFAAGARVLDAACGTGYGTARLLASGAVSIDGVDIDVATVRYARRHSPDSRVRFQVGDLEKQPLPLGSFDLVVSSNTLEHLRRPDSFLQRLASSLAPGGRVVVALPPIYSESDLAVHARIAYHRSSLSVRAWHDLFRSLGWSVTLFGQRLAAEFGTPDFTSPYSSRLRAEDFSFVPLGLDAFYEKPSIGAIYVLRRVA
jgi:SAM-dependent methyltransferase